MSPWRIFWVVLGIALIGSYTERLSVGDGVNNEGVETVGGAPSHFRKLKNIFLRSSGAEKRVKRLPTTTETLQDRYKHGPITLFRPFRYQYDGVIIKRQIRTSPPTPATRPSDKPTNTPKHTMYPSSAPSAMLSRSINPSLSENSSSAPSISLKSSATPSMLSIDDSPTMGPSKSLNPSTSSFPSTSPVPSYEPSNYENYFSPMPSNPTIIVEPSLAFIPSLEPSLSKRPDASMEPSKIYSQSHQPSLSNPPSVSAKPSTSSFPSTSLRPSGKPSVSSSPLLSTLPSTDSIPSTAVPDPTPDLTGCSICGDGKEVGNPDANFTFPGQPPVSCGALEIAGQTGSISVDDCSLFLGLIGVCEYTAAPTQNSS